MNKESLSQETLKELLSYMPETGVFTWNRTGTGRKDVAGTVRKKDGYRFIHISHVKHSAHRLAFLYMDGKFPVQMVDHINRKRDDNRWCNLRNSTTAQNQNNMVSNNPFIGVYWHISSSRWTANSKTVLGKRKHLGTFKTNLAACYARHVSDIEGVNND